MKMIYAVGCASDVNIVMYALNQAGFAVTKVSTTGGFLRKRNATLFTVVQDDQIQQVLDIFSEECGKRKQISYPTPYPESSNGYNYAAIPSIPVDVGGATIFVLNVEQCHKL